MPVVYFRPQEVGVYPGSNGDGEAARISTAILPTHGAITAAMEGGEYFLSMIPVSAQWFEGEDIPAFVHVPRFASAFAPIGEFLRWERVTTDCDIELTVRTGRGVDFGDPTERSLALCVFEHAWGTDGKPARRRLRVPVALDESSEDIEALYRFYSGAKSGAIVWKWKNPVSSS